MSPSEPVGSGVARFPAPGRRAAVRPLLYAARPIHTYKTSHDDVCLRWLTEAVHGWEVVDPAELWRDNTEWLAGWPHLLPTPSCLVVYAEEVGFVGVGCIRETADAVVARIPVLGFDLSTGLSETVSFDLEPPVSRTPQRAAQLVLGGCTHACRSVLREGAA